MEKYNYEEILKNDLFGLDGEIREVFPDAQIVLVYNGYSVKAIKWLIGISPLNTVYVISDNRYDHELSIGKFIINANEYIESSELTHKLLFHGAIPPNDKMEPDMEFIKKILKNHDTIGKAL